MKSLISRLLCSLPLLTLLNATAYADMADINRIYHALPAVNSFEICHAGGCSTVSSVNLTQVEWDNIAKLFAPMPTNATQERALIAKAIGLLEDIVGLKIGTTGDRAGTFDNANYHGQLDCNDEAINSTTYMRLLNLAGFLHFHQIEDTRTRNFFFTGWPHTTAVIQDLETKEHFAVDSWFYDNGHPATIVPLAVWKNNYMPEDSPIGKVKSAQKNTPNSAQVSITK